MKLTLFLGIFFLFSLSCFASVSEQCFFIPARGERCTRISNYHCVSGAVAGRSYCVDHIEYVISSDCVFYPIPEIFFKPDVGSDSVDLSLVYRYLRLIMFCCGGLFSFFTVYMIFQFIKHRDIL